MILEPQEAVVAEVSGLVDEAWERGAAGVVDAVQRLTQAEADDDEGRAVRAATEAMMTAGASATLTHLAVRDMPGSATPAEQRGTAGIDAAAIVSVVAELC